MEYVEIYGDIHFFFLILNHFVLSWNLLPRLFWICKVQWFTFSLFDFILQVLSKKYIWHFNVTWLNLKPDLKPIFFHNEYGFISVLCLYLFITYLTIPSYRFILSFSQWHWLLIVLLILGYNFLIILGFLI